MGIPRDLASSSDFFEVGIPRTPLSLPVRSASPSALMNSVAVDPVPRPTSISFSTNRNAACPASSLAVMGRQDTFVPMAWPKIFRIGTILLIATLATDVSAGVKFHVTWNNSPIAIKFTGRLVVYVKKSNGKAPTTQISGPDYLYGVDATVDAMHGAVDVGDSATAYPMKPSQLPSGDYVAQAVLDWHHDDTNWRREPGNMYS